MADVAHTPRTIGQIVDETLEPSPMQKLRKRIFGNYSFLAGLLIILIIFFRILPVPAYIMLGLWLAMQFIGGLGADPDTGGVAYWAHAGGFGVGLILTLPLWLRRGGMGFWQQTHGTPPHPEGRYALSATRIPRVPRKTDQAPRNGPWGR